MNRRERRTASIPVLVCAGAAACVIFACSERPGFDQKNDVFAPQPEGGLVEPPRPPPSCGVHCSRDLKQVLDGCEGAETVVETCSQDQGCGEGKCVDACTAATLTKGSAGCDFWTVPPTGTSPDAKVMCFAAMIANTWDRGVNITAELGGDGLDISKATYLVHREDDEPVYTRLEGPLPPGAVAVVFLSHDTQTPPGAHAVFCPETVTPALLVDPIEEGTVRNRAFHIKTDAPVSAYSIGPYGGARSFEPTGTLLLPVSSWTGSYIAVAPGFTAPRANASEWLGGRTLQIIANEDGTEVSIRPNIDVLPGTDVAGTRAGTTQTWTLKKGEVLQLVQDGSLAGSPIEATKPVGVFGGAECAFIPAGVPYCDMLQQQIPPLSQWGSEYAVVPFAPRIPTLSSEMRERVPYTIVGAADGTTLTYEPSKPRGAPETLAAGQTVDFITDELFVVKSQDSKHPFYVSVYMTGTSYGGGFGDPNAALTMGDPDFVNVPPSDQFLDRYVFFTDHTYPETTLTVVRRKTAAGFMPVELECGGEIDDWRPLGSSGRYEYAWVTLTTGFVEQRANGKCSSYGRQEAHSKGPFAVTVWGMELAASYGYVAGTGLRPINDAAPPAIK